VEKLVNSVDNSMRSTQICIDEYCFKKEQSNEFKHRNLDAKTEPETCEPEPQETLTALTASRNAALLALHGTETSLKVTEAASTAAGFGGIVVVLGSGGGAAGAAAFATLESTVSIPHQVAITAENIAIAGLNQAIEELNGRNGGCHYETSKTTHDLSFELLLLSEHLTCPYSEDQQENFVTINGGCDGQDNDCDSTILHPPLVSRVDECDEDRVPPSITLIKKTPVFKSESEAKEWFMLNTVAADDCVFNLVKTIKSVSSRVEDGKTIYSITMKVVDPRCVNKTEELAFVHGVEMVVDGPGASSTEEIFEFAIDGTGPTVVCGFNKQQHIHHVNDPNFISDGTMIPPFPIGDDNDPLHIDFAHDKEHLVDVKLWYDIEDNVAVDVNDKIQVNITVTSNEYENNGRDMVNTVETFDLGHPDSVHRAELYLAPFTCHDSDYDNKVTCRVEKAHPPITSRFYNIEVAAADINGNVGKATCSVVVVPQCHRRIKYSSGHRLTSEGKGKGHICKGKGKGIGKEKGDSPYHPNILAKELKLSVNRYLISFKTHEWDPKLRTSRNPPPIPTFPPKGKGKGHRSSSANIRKYSSNSRPPSGPRKRS